jgi:carboxylate-amine ligase
MVKELAEHFDAGERLGEYPYEMLDENKWLARATGWTASSSTCRPNERVPSKALAARLLERLRPHAEDLGAAEALDGVQDLLDRGTGAHRQVGRLRGQPRPARGHARESEATAP